MADIALRFSCFVTGTDTDIGKTLIASALLQALTQRGVKAVGMKPVAAGATLRDDVWHNDDADSLAAAGNLSLPPALTTPYLLRIAAAPHIAAAREGKVIELAPILDCYAQLTAAADAVVVEGVGGFRVPLSDSFDTADLAQQLGLPVILVVGLRLGCLNQALLTAEAIAARGLTLAGWVANQVEVGMSYGEDNVAALSARIAAPLLGCVPRLVEPSPAAAAACLDFTGLPGWPA
ncbi:MAG: dethiobiotin synthase [Glaciimonas sp.]|nr:dethiobiotin synthase [Glaciimonas sp.]